MAIGRSHQELPEAGHTPQAIGFVFEMGLRKLEEQHKQIDALDLKMTVLIGFLGAVIAALIAVATAVDPQKLRPLLSWGSAISLGVALLLTGIGLLGVFLAFRIRDYYGGIRFDDLVPYAATDIAEIQEVFLPTIQCAIIHNNAKLGEKQWHARYAIWSLFTAFVLYLVGLFLIARRLF